MFLVIYVDDVYILIKKKSDTLLNLKTIFKQLYILRKVAKTTCCYNMQDNICFVD